MAEVEEVRRQPWQWWREEEWWRSTASNAGGGLILAVVLRPELWLWVLGIAVTGLSGIGAWTWIKRVRAARADRAAVLVARAPFRTSPPARHRVSAQSRAFRSPALLLSAALMGALAASALSLIEEPPAHGTPSIEEIVPDSDVPWYER